MFIRLNFIPKIAITPSTTNQLRNIGMNASRATQMFLNDSKSTTRTKSEEISRTTL